MFARGLLRGETSGVAGASEDVIKALAPILEALGTIGEVAALIRLSEAICIEKEKEPPVVALDALCVEKEGNSSGSSFGDYDI